MTKPMAPVAHRGKMVLAPGERFRRYQPENHEWRDQLCDRDKYGRLIGKDPMEVPLDVLTASGHPQARASALVFRLRVMQGQDSGEMKHDPLPFPTPHKLKGDVRKYCLGCSNGNEAEVRRCPIYDCPAWPYRMGRNPHNPRRGANPFAQEDEAA
ncbi:hypothetical protein [Sinorhizobium fredii]|uniref:hypothetical protein n=1 Tax=Rhizobium fredii TaxID=380 RepID=UPI0012FD0DE1|nr:hypothetical protein [Sinorhizobium fredii]